MTRGWGEVDLERGKGEDMDMIKMNCTKSSKN